MNKKELKNMDKKVYTCSMCGEMFDDVFDIRLHKNENKGYHK